MKQKLCTFIIGVLVTLLFVPATAQVSNCPTCKKPIPVCAYKGKHPKKATTTQKKPAATKNTQKPASAAKPVQKTTPSAPVTPVSSFNNNPQNFRVGDVFFTMRPVEGGSFYMGSNNGDSDEKPVHQVTLSSYYIGGTEVTQELWMAVMGNNPSHFKDLQNPVEQVSYNDCKEFINRLRQLTGRNFRLPTEAEWEYASRGGRYSGSYTYAGSNNIDAVAWYTGNSGSKTHHVGMKQANELGLYDMTGNVWEWCEDWYGSYGSQSVTNPRGPEAGSNRVYRGGSGNDFAGDCRSAYRSCSNPTNQGGNLGFRLAL